MAGRRSRKRQIPRWLLAAALAAAGLLTGFLLGLWHARGPVERAPRITGHVPPPAPAPRRPVTPPPPPAPPARGAPPETARARGPPDPPAPRSARPRPGRHHLRRRRVQPARGRGGHEPRTPCDDLRAPGPPVLDPGGRGGGPPGRRGHPPTPHGAGERCAPPGAGGRPRRHERRRH